MIFIHIVPSIVMTQILLKDMLGLYIIDIRFVLLFCTNISYTQEICVTFKRNTKNNTQYILLFTKYCNTSLFHKSTIYNSSINN